MHPWIRPNDVLTISPLKTKLPKFGDVVAACHPVTGKLLVHRVIARQGSKRLLKGDNIPMADGTFFQNDILGRVETVHRNGRRVLLGVGITGVAAAVISRHGWHLKRFFMWFPKGVP